MLTLQLEKAPLQFGKLPQVHPPWGKGLHLLGRQGKPFSPGNQLLFGWATPLGSWPQRCAGGPVGGSTPTTRQNKFFWRRTLLLGGRSGSYVPARPGREVPLSAPGWTRPTRRPTRPLPATGPPCWRGRATDVAPPTGWTARPRRPSASRRPPCPPRRTSATRPTPAAGPGAPCPHSHHQLAGDSGGRTRVNCRQTSAAFAGNSIV